MNSPTPTPTPAASPVAGDAAAELQAAIQTMADLRGGRLTEVSASMIEALLTELRKKGYELLLAR